jgi:hypothetical protein
MCLVHKVLNLNMNVFYEINDNVYLFVSKLGSSLQSKILIANLDILKTFEVLTDNLFVLEYFFIYHIVLSLSSG